MNLDLFVLYYLICYCVIPKLHFITVAVYCCFCLFQLLNTHLLHANEYCLLTDLTLPEVVFGS